MPPALIPDDDEYASSEDSDFTPDNIPTQDDGETSEDESEADAPAVKARPKKRKCTLDDEAEDLGIENSGDELIIIEGKKEKKKAKKGRKGKDRDEDEGGEGGLVKTRSMRALEKVEKKPLTDTSAATIDVDAVWQAMLSGKSDPSSEQKPILNAAPNRSISPETKRLNAVQSARNGTRSPSTTLSEGPSSMIMIKRTYKFAGKVHIEEKLVPRSSAEAKLFLATHPDPSTIDPAPVPPDPFKNGKRPPKLARRSIFEPAIELLPQRTDLYFGVRKESNLSLVGITGKEKKLNTVEKSAMDWAGFVDKEGIADELDAAGKSKGAYKARQEFLARVEQKKEEESRRARGLPI